MLASHQPPKARVIESRESSHAVAAGVAMVLRWRNVAWWRGFETFKASSAALGALKRWPWTSRL